MQSAKVLCEASISAKRRVGARAGCGSAIFTPRRSNPFRSPAICASSSKSTISHLALGGCLTARCSLFRWFSDAFCADPPPVRSACTPISPSYRCFSLQRHGGRCSRTSVCRQLRFRSAARICLARPRQCVGRSSHGQARAAFRPSGAVSIAADDLHFPNGTVITPDGKTLIVAETLAGRLTAFDVAADGALSNRRLWAATAPRAPDGIALDASGAIWIANPTAAECVRIAEGGKVLDVVATSRNCYACMLGGDDGKTLFMTTAPSVTSGEPPNALKGRIEIATVDVPHAGLP